MPDGIFAAASGMAAQSARMDALSNDIANVNTTGYKQVELGFRDLVYDAQQGVRVGTGAAVVDLGRSLAQGPIQQVDNPLALAIQGSGYFQVKRADGQTALTRAGDFKLDAAGDLVTAGGEQLVPPIRLPKGASASDVTISADGAVSAKGAKIGQIELVDVPAPAGLQSVGDNLFVTTTASGAAGAATGWKVQQGAVEGSNVDLASEMVDMIDAQRGFQLASQAIKTQDELMQTANDIRR